jgi:ATP-dependent helicase HrpB
VRKWPDDGLSARISMLLKDALGVTNRCIRVRIQVLAPSNRPVQITEKNLGDFWRDTHPKLKLQLQRRYPKHEWR